MPEKPKVIRDLVLEKSMEEVKGNKEVKNERVSLMKVVRSKGSRSRTHDPFDCSANPRMT